MVVVSGREEACRYALDAARRVLARVLSANSDEGHRGVLRAARYPSVAGQHASSRVAKGQRRPFMLLGWEGNNPEPRARRHTETE